MDLRKTCKVLKPFLPSTVQDKFQETYSVMIDAVNDMDVVRTFVLFIIIIYEMILEFFIPQRIQKVQFLSINCIVVVLFGTNNRWKYCYSVRTTVQYGQLFSTVI